MPQVRLYEGGQVRRQGTTDARVRAADFGESPLAAGLQAAGKGLSDAVERQDQIEDVKARVEANRLAVEHSEHVRQIGRTVTQTLGEGAEDAANNGIAELEKANKDILGRASPRARLLLDGEIRTRSGAASDQWLDHGFRQKADALETSSVARASRVIEDAADLDDEDAAVAMMGEIKGINEKRAQFFGKGKAWLDQENGKMISGFYKSRALKLTQGQGGSASAAIGYAEQHRSMLTDDDYNAIVSGYNDAAQDEAAMTFVYGGSPVGAHTVAAPKGEDGPQARLDGTAFFKAFVAPHEGSAYVVDSNGKGVKYGINAQYNPGVDVKNLTVDAAASIFAKNYFEKSGADKLPPALAAVHADTFFLNEKQAGKILRESGGDVDKYIELRRAFLNGLATSNPGKYGKYKDGWENRTKALADFADRQGGDGRRLPLAVDENTSLETIRSAVFARDDIGLNLKRKIISALEGRRAEVRQERAIREEDADRRLTDSMVAQGENFTDIKQLPQDAWLAANPSTRNQLQNAAESNKKAAENKPLTPAQAARIGFIQTFSPQSFADPKVQRQLIKEGVPVGKVTELAAIGGQAMGKVDNVPREQLMAVARDAYEASGYRFWTIEHGDEKSKKKGLTDAEQKADALRQTQLLSFLDAEARAWAINNPGKTADLKTIQGWVGTSMVRLRGPTGTSGPVGLLTDQEVANIYGQANWDNARRKLKAAGIEPTPETTAEYLRRSVRRYHGQN